MSDKEYLILDHSIQRFQSDTNIFVRLVCLEPNEILYSKPRRMIIHEAFGMISPIIVLTIVDARGDLFNHMNIDTGAKFRLYFGRSLTESITMDLRIAKYEQGNSVVGLSHEMEMKITFVIDNWFDCVAKKINRAWKDKTHSEIIQDIASACQFEDIEVTPTKGVQSSVVQPWWSNKTMLSWLKPKCIPEDTSDGHFEYGTTIDKRFKMIAINDLFKKRRQDIVNKKVPIMRMQAPPDQTNSAGVSRENNGNVPAYFVAIRQQHQYMSGISNGAGGVVAMNFDWEHATFNRQSVNFSELQVPQLSTYSSIRDRDVDVDKPMYGGRDVETYDQAKVAVSESALSMTATVVTTEGCPFINIFDIVELVIPNTTQESTLPVNEIHSGFYLVGGVQHIFSFSSIAQYNGEITLLRHGVDEIAYDGFEDLVESAAGKIV